MGRKISGPRKQRRREHVLADLSWHHVVGIILRQGYTAELVRSDYGYDLMMTTYDEDGYIEPDQTPIQLKAAESWEVKNNRVAFDVDIRDYNLWRNEYWPVYLVLYDASLRCAYWIHFQEHCRAADSLRPRPKAKTVRIQVPAEQVVREETFALWRRLKFEIREQQGSQS